MVMQQTDKVLIAGFLQAAESGKLVQSIDALHGFLLQQNLAWKQTIHCDHVGVHSQNRDGLGCSSSHVHELIKSITSIGYSGGEARGICIEIPHGPDGDEIRELMSDLSTMLEVDWPQ